MNLLYICSFQFDIRNDGVYSSPAYGDSFWGKYLNSFDSITVLGEPEKDYIKDNSLVKIKDERIKVFVIPANSRPQDLVNDRAVKRELRKHISTASAILIKPASRKGVMAIRLAKKYNKNYCIELTGDLNLSLKTHKSLIRRLYRPIIHNKIVHAIKDCKYGLYVTSEYLQKVYPIRGYQCGCTDTVLPSIDESVLHKRIQKIKESNNGITTIKLGLIGTYHDNRKGIDTAIKAISILDNKRIELHILGRGIEEDRKRWYSFAEKEKSRSQLFFDSPKSSQEEVFSWIDSIDIIILPSRSEGLPRCIVEAMSRACPCITSDVCGLPELIDKKWVHSPNDFRCLANHINAMVENVDEMIQSAELNFKKAHDFLLENLNKRRSMFFEKIITDIESQA